MALPLAYKNSFYNFSNLLPISGKDLLTSIFIHFLSLEVFLLYCYNNLV